MAEHWPSDVFHERTIRIHYEGPNAHIALMAVVQKMAQAMYADALKMEHQAQIIEQQAQQLGLQYQPQQPQQLPQMSQQQILKLLAQMQGESNGKQQ